MSFEFDLSNVPEDASRIQDGGGDRPTPGRGMAVIREWVEYGAVNGQAHKLALELVAWTTATDVGKFHDESIFHQDRSGKGHPMKRMTALAMAAGLFTPADVARWKAERKNPSIDMQAMVNRPIMIELAEDGMTMICVTHEMGFAQAVANRVVFMDQGQIVEQNEPKEFFANPKSDRTKLFLSQILGH